MSGSLWLVFAAAALWLWASLVPQVTYPTASSGEPAGDVLFAWPGWAVQQDLGQLSGTIGRFQIWVSSAPDGGELTVEASLVDASTKEVLRQTTINATPLYTPIPRTLTFPSYDVPEGRRLLLQLEVAAFERRPVIYGLSHAQSEHSNLALNGVPDAGSGPLAFMHQVTSSGLRAALHGLLNARIQLILALVLTGLTALAIPIVGLGVGIRRVGNRRKALTRRATVWRRRLGWPNHRPYAGGPPTESVRVLAMPWYPWSAALTPVLHYLASNTLHFTFREALVPAGVVLLVVTVALAGLWLALRDWHQAAAAVTAVTIVVFAYGHIEQASDGLLNDHVLFPSSAILAAASVGMVVRSRYLVLNWTPFLNVTAIVLLFLQIISLATESGSNVPTPEPLSSPFQHDTGYRPDIYYIVLDGYGRQDSLLGFDNSSFLEQLEERDFMIATEATSNYSVTIESLASILNLDYLHNLGSRTPKTKSDGIALIQNNKIATTLKSLGYTYVHLESGYVATSCAPHADLTVIFTPARVVVADDEETRDCNYPQYTQNEWSGHDGFLHSLVDTTALRPVFGHRFARSSSTPYDYWSPERALRMFAFLSEPMPTSGPTFVFAHILKPHQPATFDRHGNILVSQRVEHGFSDTHDRTVPNAYIGQLIFINSLVLRMVDSILDNHVENPIIVIAGDHAFHSYGEKDRQAILAAFHFPDGGDSMLYPSISSVNHFRYILDYYFGFDLGVLDDFTVSLNLESN